MLHIPLVESSYWVCNISGENLYLINSGENQLTSTQMWDLVALPILLKSSLFDESQGSKCTFAFWN